MTTSNSREVVRAVCLCLVLTLAVMAPAAAAPADFQDRTTASTPIETVPETPDTDGVLDEMNGSGTPEDPYVITNVTELQAMNENASAHYVLGNDVNASATHDWNYEKGFEPVGDGNGYFTGSFDGRNHTVHGLYIDRPNKDDVGLFEWVDSGTVENVHVVDADVTGNGYTGIVAGLATGPIRNVHVEGTVVGNDNVGGVVGTATTLHYTSANVDVEGNEFVGGITGQTNTITESYATGSVSGTDHVGGFVGKGDSNAENIEFRDNYAAATVDGEYVGGFAATLFKGDGGIYWSSEVAGIQRGVAGNSYANPTTDLSRSAMRGADARRNMALPWGERFVATSGYPVHRAQIESIDVNVPSDVVVTGNETTVTVTFTLESGRTVNASRTATLSTNNSLASVDDAVLAAGSQNGTVNVTATQAGFSDSTTVPVVTPANVNLERFDAPTAVLNGSRAMIRIWSHNDGGATGSNTVRIGVDGDRLASVKATVDGYETKRQSYAWTPDGVGEYDVVVGDAPAQTTTVVARDSVHLTNATVPDRVVTNDSFVAELEFENDADVPVSVPVTHIADSKSTTEQVTVAPGSATATISLTADAAAGSNVTHRFEALGNASAATATVVAHADLAASVSVPETATTGDEVTVEATVSNDGGVAASTPVEVRVDGEVVATENVTVGRQTTKTVSATTTVESAGDFEVRVVGDGNFSARASLSVSESTTTTSTDGGSTTTQADDESTTTAATSDEEPTTTASDGSPGFGLSGAALALLVAFVARRFAP